MLKTYVDDAKSGVFMVQNVSFPDSIDIFLKVLTPTFFFCICIFSESVDNWEYCRQQRQKTFPFLCGWKIKCIFAALNR